VPSPSALASRVPLGLGYVQLGDHVGVGIGEVDSQDLGALGQQLEPEAVGQIQIAALVAL